MVECFCFSKLISECYLIHYFIALTADYLSDESDDTEDGGSDDDDYALVDSKDSLGQHVKSTDEAIPHDAFEVFKCWMSRIWEYYKPSLLNDGVCVSYLLIFRVFYRIYMVGN